VELTAIVDCDRPPDATLKLDGLNDTVNPVGAESLRATVPAKPLTLAILMSVLTVLPVRG